jgi:hypothetical protein
MIYRRRPLYARSKADCGTRSAKRGRAIASGPRLEIICPETVPQGSRHRLRLRARLLQSVASIALICVAGGRAFAACEPPNPGSGGTVTCSATDNDGYTAPANTAVTINVESGASVTGTGINVSGRATASSTISAPSGARLPSCSTA